MQASKIPISERLKRKRLPQRRLIRLRKVSPRSQLKRRRIVLMKRFNVNVFMVSAERARFSAISVMKDGQARGVTTN